MIKFKRTFAHEVFTARHELQLTQETVADLAGVSVRWYQMIENGSRVPSSLLLLRLCAILQIDASIFYDVVGLDHEQLLNIVPQRTNAYNPPL